MDTPKKKYFVSNGFIPINSYSTNNIQHLALAKEDKPIAVYVPMHNFSSNVNEIRKNISDKEVKEGGEDIGLVAPPKDQKGFGAATPDESLHYPIKINKFDLQQKTGKKKPSQKGSGSSAKKARHTFKLIDY
jgi:hypothetical protein